MLLDPGVLPVRRSLLLVVTLAFAGCSCGQKCLIFAGPHAVVTPGAGADGSRLLEFGKVRVGSRLYDASLKSKLDSLKFALKRA